MRTQREGAPPVRERRRHAAERARGATFDRAGREAAGLDPAFTEKFLRFVVAEVIRHHQRIAEGEHL